MNNFDNNSISLYLKNVNDYLIKYQYKNSTPLLHFFNDLFFKCKNKSFKSFSDIKFIKHSFFHNNLSHIISVFTTHLDLLSSTLNITINLKNTNIDYYISLLKKILKKYNYKFYSHSFENINYYSVKYIKKSSNSLYLDFL